jgi:hypothetical protein
MKEKHDRGTCPSCGYRCYVSVPRGGDGSVRVCATHYIYYGAEKQRCDGSRTVCKEDQKHFGVQS